MREAIGSAFLVNLILIFIGVISALVVGSISYSKAYKVKDRIIYIIEKYDAYDDSAKQEINTSLKNVGYNISNTSKCEKIYKNKNGKSYDSKKLLHGKNLGTNDYNYCVYKYECTAKDAKNNKCVSTYYGVTTFMHFDVPLISGLLEFAISGETSVDYGVIDN